MEEEQPVQEEVERDAAAGELPPEEDDDGQGKVMEEEQLVHDDDVERDAAAACLVAMMSAVSPDNGIGEVSMEEDGQVSRKMSKKLHAVATMTKQSNLSRKSDDEIKAMQPPTQYVEEKAFQLWRHFFFGRALENTCVDIFCDISTNTPT
jgi:hypothetical protein